MNDLEIRNPEAYKYINDNTIGVEKSAEVSQTWLTPYEDEVDWQKEAVDYYQQSKVYSADEIKAVKEAKKWKFLPGSKKNSQ